jgi:dienelactone hydrolase
MRKPRTIIRRAAAILAICAPALSHAAVLEEVIEVPVSVRTIHGREASQNIKVTVFRDDRREKAPYLVLNHGRPASEADFPRMGRQRFAENSRYFVNLGFVVFVPTRVGYGESGGPDVESSGHCDSRNFAPAYAAAADQTVAVLQTARSLFYADPSRGMVVGQSFGGMVSMALAARGIPGLAGAVNFAGGGGGNPSLRPGNPCSADRLAALYENYGSASNIPTLWLYSENDRFWGPELPRKWFNGYVAAGGKARFVQLPPHRDDGHEFFTGNPGSWKPAFEAFLRDIGF